MTRWGAVVIAVVCALGCSEATPPADDGGADAGGCPADCDDRLFCNGVERCVSGECVGDPPCALGETCDEDADACLADCGAATDADGDGVDAIACGGDDCDDADPARHPLALEICDGLDRDEDCDPTTFGDRDVDDDGAIDAACCNGTTCGTDCNDLAPAIRVGATEACNRFDDDCDGAVDETVEVDGFADRDRDGRGDPAMPMRACAGQSGFSIHDDDCNDANVEVSGVQSELCDAIDNDCDEVIDEAALPVLWYPDVDGDGFGDPRGTTVMSCEPVAGRSILATDCDDRSTARSPRVPEVCNAIDDDCYGGADFFVAPGDTEDDDHDGVADAACVDVPDAVDCDDRDPEAAGGRQEICNGRDDDCDGVRDEACVDCITDAHCGGGARCVGNVCEPECGSEGMCPAGTTCCSGACVDTTANGAHCGACDAQCVLFSAFPACEAGECVIARCAAPYEDCDGSDANGCEIDTTRSTLHCGACGAACMLPHANATCAARACRIASCDPGWADCNGNPDDGCESDLLSDEANCGACERACTPDRGASSVECISAACRITGCETGAFDCNGGLDDGCEVRLGPPPGASCRNVLASVVGSYPQITVNHGSLVEALTDGRVCGPSAHFDFGGNRYGTTIDFDLGPGPHAVSRIHAMLGGSLEGAHFFASDDGVTYTRMASWDSPPPGRIATYDYATPRDLRYVRVVPLGGDFYPWAVHEIAIYECP